VSGNSVHRLAVRSASISNGDITTRIHYHVFGRTRTPVARQVCAFIRQISSPVQQCPAKMLQRDQARSRTAVGHSMCDWRPTRHICCKPARVRNDHPGTSCGDPSKTCSSIADVSDLGPVDMQVCLLELHQQRHLVKSMSCE
jgi:hypothetical protein